MKRTRIDWIEGPPSADAYPCLVRWPDADLCLARHRVCGDANATHHCPLDIPKPRERPPAGLYAVRYGTRTTVRSIDGDGVVSRGGQKYYSMHWSEYEWGPRLPDDWK